MPQRYIEKILKARVYDVADTLAERGLLEVEEGEPKRYRAISRDEIRASLADQYEQTLDPALLARELLHGVPEDGEAVIGRT